MVSRTGPLEIETPRDRNGDFEPQLVKKRQRRVTVIDEKTIPLYAKGMTTGEIQAIHEGSSPRWTTTAKRSRNTVMTRVIGDATPSRRSYAHRPAYSEAAMSGATANGAKYSAKIAASITMRLISISSTIAPSLAPEPAVA